MSQPRLLMTSSVAERLLVTMPHASVFSTFFLGTNAPYSKKFFLLHRMNGLIFTSDRSKSPLGSRLRLAFDRVRLWFHIRPNGAGWVTNLAFYNVAVVFMR